MRIRYAIANRNRLRLRNRQRNADLPTGLPAKKAKTDNEQNFNNNNCIYTGSFRVRNPKSLRVSQKKRRIRITYEISTTTTVYTAESFRVRNPKSLRVSQQKRVKRITYEIFTTTTVYISTDSRLNKSFDGFLSSIGTHK